MTRDDENTTTISSEFVIGLKMGTNVLKIKRIFPNNEMGLHL